MHENFHVNSKRNSTDKEFLPISSPFLATLHTTEAGVIIAGKVFDRSKGGTSLRELLVPVCAASAAAAALKQINENDLNGFEWIISFFCLERNAFNSKMLKCNDIRHKCKKVFRINCRKPSIKSLCTL